MTIPIAASRMLQNATLIFKRIDKLFENVAALRAQLERDKEALNVP